MSTHEHLLWLILGFSGQALFALRFIVQWWRSERAGRSLIPIQFWYLSLGGGLLLLAYAIHKLDPVFILGQVTGLFVYLRNLHLIQRAARQDEDRGRAL
ncbi:MAG TPA: lipid-A-disaccharide synthase N-terminal domain-containing protein [Candidatus Competibacteraceae bacterium]|nr:lipid-A-disaccharide synthase N-terminal domain-containing protein [Candidatus Competibacteraceae bacterium]